LTETGSGSTSKSIATLTVLGRLRGTPYFWVFIALCLVLALMAGLQLTGVRTELGANELHFNIQRRPGIPVIGVHDMAVWPTMALGDELLAVNGE